MSTVFIFHGIGGNSEENWFPWMKAELEMSNHRVIVPNFPHADTPRLDEWAACMKKYDESIDEETVFVGHSLGGAFALRRIEKMDRPIRGTCLVASVWKTPDNEFAPLMTTFTDTPYDWDSIKKSAGTLQILHSDNDEYLPLSYAKELQDNLACHMTVIPEGKHLNAEAGYTEFPTLRDTILTLL